MIEISIYYQLDYHCSFSENAEALVSELLRRLEDIDAMKDSQGFIHRNIALWYLGGENWDLEDALETFLLQRGINHGTKCGNQRNALSINMTGMKMFVTSNPNICFLACKLMLYNANQFGNR